jgi:hypothetical protein
MELGRQKMNSQSARAATGKRHAGPNLGIVATVYVLLKIASVFPVSAFGSNPPFFPGLNAPTETVVSYFSRHAHAVLVCAFLQLGAAIPFGIFAATVASRLQFLEPLVRRSHSLEVPWPRLTNWTPEP